MFRLRITNTPNCELRPLSSFKPSKPINHTNYLFRRNQSNMLNRENSKHSVTLGTKTPDKFYVDNNLKNGLPILASTYQRSQTSINFNAKPNSGRSTYRDKSQTYDCTCILCLNKMIANRKKSKTAFGIKSKENWTVDTKHFFETLDQIRTSIKVSRDANDLNNSLTDSDQKSDSFSNESKPRYLHKTSRIKLWKPSEIDKWASNYNLSSSEFDTDFSENLDSLSKESNSSLQQRDSVVNYQLNETSDIIKQDYPSNPPTSPLSFYRIPVALPMED